MAHGRKERGRYCYRSSEIHCRRSFYSFERVKVPGVLVDLPSRWQQSKITKQPILVLFITRPLLEIASSCLKMRSCNCIGRSENYSRRRCCDGAKSEMFIGESGIGMPAAVRGGDRAEEKVSAFVHINGPNGYLRWHTCILAAGLGAALECKIGDYLTRAQCRFYDRLVVWISGTIWDWGRPISRQFKR